MNGPLVATGALLSVTGLAVVAAPERFRQVLGWFLGEGRYGLAVLGRLVVGLVLLLGAARSRVPALSLTLGGLFLVAAALVPLAGEERIGRLVGWWLARGAGPLRAWGAVVVALGGLILWLGS